MFLLYCIRNGDESYQVTIQINGWDIGSYIRLDDTPINVYKDEFIIVELIFDNGCNSSMWIGGCNNTQLRGNIMTSNTGYNIWSTCILIQDIFMLPYKQVMLIKFH